MDPAALASRLEAVEGRLAGTDAERRAAALCARELRRAGRTPRSQPVWWRPQRAAPRALWALLGVAGSVVAVSHAVVGTALVGAALLAVLLDCAGVRVLAPVLIRHATQNVVAPALGPRDGRVVLMLVGAVDAPRRSLARRLERTSAGGPLPGPMALVVLALIAVLACAGVRIGGADGTALSVVQLVPSVLLILLAGLFIDAATAPAVDPAPAAGVAAALAVAATLDARPPRTLAPEVVVAGAGEAGAAGMAAIVRARRETLAPEEVVVIELAAAPAGEPGLAYVVRDGELFGSRLHPRLVELASRIPRARAIQRRGRSAARVARGEGWPAIRLEGDARGLAAATLRLVAAVDREVVERRTGHAPG